MAGMDGLAYLMSLIGGAGKGQYEGYAGGIQDQKDAANLAERKRQFDEGQFTDITPEMGTRLGVPAGRTRNTLIPSLLNASEKEAARKEAQMANEQGAQALSKAASDMGTPSTANPEVAGTEAPSSEVVTPAKPEPFLSMMSGLQRAGVKTENPLLVQWMKNQQAAAKLANGSDTTSQIVQDADGNFIAVPKPKGLTGPTPTGVEGNVTRSSEYKAISDKLIAQGYRRGTPEYKMKLAEEIERMIPVPAGGDVYRKSGVPPAPGQTSAPGPQVGFEQFAADSRRAGKSEDQIAKEWADLNSGKPTSVTIPGPKAYGPSISRPARTGTETIRGAAQAQYAVDEMSQLAKEISGLGPDVQTRLSQAWRQEAQSVPFLNAIQFLTPQEQDIATRLRHAQIRYEAAVSGLRGAGSPQMYERFQKIIGPFTGATTPAALNALSRSMAEYLNELNTFEQSVGNTGFPGAIRPSPAPNPQEAPKATGQEWVRDKNGRLVPKK